MGRYYNPNGNNPTEADMAKIGRRVKMMNWEADSAECGPDETLALWNQRILFTQCAELFDEAEYKEFRQQIGSGIIRASLWIVPRSTFAR